MQIQDNSIQSSFLEQVRKRLHPNISFADELAEILNISRDSAYRRIRGETVLSLEEVRIVCNHFGVSLDALLSPTAEMVSFHHRVVNHKTFPLDKWLQAILGNIEMLSGFAGEKELVYATPDVPFFHFFNHPVMSPFKMFVYMKTILHYPELTNKKYNAEYAPKELLSVGRKIWDKYSALPGTEIWSQNAYTVTLRQIEYYHECGLFEDPQQALQLCDAYLEIIKTVDGYASEGKKIPGGGEFNMYKNELWVTDTTVLFKMGERRITFITHNTMNLLNTTQESFCRHTEDYLSNLLQRSTILSPVGERDRIKYFNSIEATVNQLKNRIKSS